MKPTGEPRIALVTGASSGIGAAIARALGALGYGVALGARRTELLSQVAREVEAAGGKAYAAHLDLTDPESIDSFFDAVVRDLGAPDVIVNNAGLNVPGLLQDLDPAELQREISTNLIGPLLLTRRVVRSLLERGTPGDLVFLSSENAVVPRPYQIGYTASKAGLEAAARALRMELEGSGIRASIVRPGPTGTTGFANGWAPGVLQRLLRSWKYWGVQRHLRWLPPESVAQAVVSVVTAPPGTHLDVVQIMPEGPADVRQRALGAKRD